MKNTQTNTQVNEIPITEESYPTSSLQKEVNNKRIQTWRLLDDKEYLLKVLGDIKDQTYKDYISHIEMCHQINLIIESAQKRMEISNNYLNK